jgi:hypothetical protein
MKNPGPLAKKAVKIQMNLPYFWLSPEQNIILCGKIDWLEYLPERDSIRIIDFKTSKKDEDPKSLQLPIYYLLALNCQKRDIEGISYWYIERHNEPVEQDLPDAEEAKKTILDLSKKIKLAEQLKQFKCPHGADGCRACKPYEALIKGEAEFVGVDNRNSDVYILEAAVADEGKESIIL